SETGASLGTSLKDVLDLNDPEKLPVQANLLLQLESPQALARARQRSQRILKTIAGELETAPWYDEEWLDRQLNQAVERFDRACNRWRGLFQAAREQQRVQNEIGRASCRERVEIAAVAG